jgi:integrase
VVDANGSARIELGALDTKTRRPRAPRLTKRAHQAILELPTVLDCPWVFANPQTRRPWSRAVVLKWFRKVADECGLQPEDGERITYHTLRHSFAYVWRRRHKVPRQVIKAQGGWSTDRVFERYGITDDDELDEAVARIDATVKKIL